MTRRLSFSLSVLVSFVAAPAFAGSLHTSFAFVGDNQTPYCVIANVDTKAIEVEATATTIAGSPRTPVLDNCPNAPSTLNAGASCFTGYADSADLACHFTAKGKIRASLELVDGSGDLVQTIPATK